MNQVSITRIFSALALTLGVTIFSHGKLNHLQDYRTQKGNDPTAEVLYLPNGTGLRLMSFGYSNALSGVIWLNTVGYFGKHYSSDQHYQWLSHMCNLVTTLNSKVYDPYYFCSTMLAWEVGQPPAAVRVLSSAIKAHPDDWYFPYLRGFYNLYFLKDGVAAKADFILASQLPNAHPIAARLAGKTIAELDDPDNAIAFLRGMIQNSKDEMQRAALQQKLDHLLQKRNQESQEPSR